MYRYTNISFPSLGIDIDPVREFSIGPVSIHMYGLIIAFGLVLATMLLFSGSENLTTVLYIAAYQFLWLGVTALVSLILRKL